MIPYALGQHVEFKKLGPRLGELDHKNIGNTNSNEFMKKIIN